MRTTMRFLLLTAAFSLGVGCASTHSLNGPGEFGFLAKGGSCHQLAEDGGTAVAVAYTLGETPPPAGGKPIEPWRILAFAIREPLEARHWTRDEIFAFAKELLAATKQVGKVTGIFTAHLYFESACDLLRKGQSVQPFSLVTAKLTSCLHRDEPSEGLQCASRVIR
jgi:hypothetical protein